MQNDPMAPKAGAEPGLGGPLRMVTLVTADLAACRRLYGEALEMRAAEAEPQSISAASRAQFERLWQLRPGSTWRALHFFRPSHRELPWLRVLQFDEPGPLLRPRMNALLEGGLSVGFAMRDMHRAVEHADRLGFGTTAGIAALAMKRADGSAYESLECHLKAPDDVYALGVSRPADLAPVGPIEAGGNVGGPAYSAMVANHADPVLRFFTEVLEFEIRRDVNVSGPGPEKGLALPPGTQMRFLQVFARGATSGYLVFLDFAEAGIANPVPLGPPSRGVAMWSFPVRDLDEALRRCRGAESSMIAEPLEITESPLGSHRAASVRLPNGFPVELLEF